METIMIQVRPTQSIDGVQYYEAYVNGDVRIINDRQTMNQLSCLWNESVGEALFELMDEAYVTERLAYKRITV